MGAPVLKKATDTDPGDATKYGAPDVKKAFDIIDGSHATEAIQATAIEASAANRAIVSGSTSKLAVSTVTSTELGYLSGVTSAIQTQLDGKEPSGLVKKSGRRIPSGGTAQAKEGLMSGDVDSGTVAGSYTADGSFIKYTTAATVGSVAGTRGGYQVYCQRRFQPELYVKFQLPSTADVRMLIGFGSGSTSLPNTDDPLLSSTGFGLFKELAGTTWKIATNDGAGSTTLIDTGVAVDANPHTLGLRADAADTKFQWQLDGSAWQDVTTDIPSSTAGMSQKLYIVTNAAAAKDIYAFYAYLYIAK